MRNLKSDWTNYNVTLGSRFAIHYRKVHYYNKFAVLIEIILYRNSISKYSYMS
jgi:hypothetical protein